ncbi:MerR family transcriptional regulator [Duganella hordei]|uniref:MerR family transcriptional regulator n=1 Tax=Duganella hordei TaxID=2865934 RepID=UPI003340530C
MKIGELAERSGIAASAIRFYEQAGLLPKAARGANGYRVYAESALERLHLIHIGQNLGFTLDAIRAVMALEGAALQDGLMQNFDTRLGVAAHGQKPMMSPSSGMRPCCRGACGASCIVEVLFIASLSVVRPAGV